MRILPGKPYTSTLIGNGYKFVLLAVDVDGGVLARVNVTFMTRKARDYGAGSNRVNRWQGWAAGADDMKLVSEGPIVTIKGQKLAEQPTMGTFSSH